MKGNPKVPSLADVNAAWAKAHALGPDAADSPLRTDPFHARPFYQGVVLQALEALRDRRAKRSRSIYRPYTPAALRALRLTRLWLEFGAWP